MKTFFFFTFFPLLFRSLETWVSIITGIKTIQELYLFKLLALSVINTFLDFQDNFAYFEIEFYTIAWKTQRTVLGRIPCYCNSMLFMVWQL